MKHFLQMIPSGFPVPDSLREWCVGSYTLNEDLFNSRVDGVTSLAELHLQRFHLENQLQFLR
jgi:hypothetical protein